MSSSNVHRTCLDFERQIYAYVGPGAPSTYAPNATQGSQYTDASNGNFYVMVGTTWTLMGAGGGISQVYADAHYVQKSGDTMTGALVINNTLTIESSYQTNLGAGAINTGPSTVLGVDGSTSKIQRYSQSGIAAFLAGATITGTWTISGNYIINGAATRGMQLSFGSTTLSSAVGATNPDGYPFLAYNAGIQNNTNSWSALSAAASSSRLVITNTGIAFYTAAAGRGTGTDATFWGTPAFSITASGGFVIGNLASTARIVYGSSASTAFSMLTPANGYADLYLNDVYVAGGHGLRSTDTGGAILRFASGAPGYLDFASGDSTVSGFRLFRNGAVAGYLYAAQYSTGTESYVGLLNNAGNWMVQLNPNSLGGGTLFSTWVAAARFVFSEYAQFSYSSGFTAGYIGSAQTAGALINGSNQGDLGLRSENKRILFSLDAGNTITAMLDSSGLHAHDFILT